MQAMGENVVAAVPAFAKYLNKASAGGANPNIPLSVPPSQESTYFDLAGIWMISYKVALGRWIHNLALPLLLLLPPPGVRRGGMVKGMGICLLSMLGGLSMPAGVGAVRAVLSGIFLVQLPWSVQIEPVSLVVTLLTFIPHSPVLADNNLQHCN